MKFDFTDCKILAHLKWENKFYIMPNNFSLLGLLLVANFWTKHFKFWNLP